MDNLTIVQEAFISLIEELEVLDESLSSYKKAYRILLKQAMKKAKSKNIQTPDLGTNEIRNLFKKHNISAVQGSDIISGLQQRRFSRADYQDRLKAGKPYGKMK